LKWIYSTPQANLLLDDLNQARTYEEWQEVALRLDQHLDNDLWRRGPIGSHFDSRLIIDRSEALNEAIEADDVEAVESIFRASLLRNLGNVTSPNLFSVAYAGTKITVDQFVRAMCLAIRYLAALPVHTNSSNGMTAQEKMDLMHDSRQAYGRSALLLQGGAIYGLCHFGIVKALHLRGLLPRIVVGQGIGALVAALVCIHREQELAPFLNCQSEILATFDVEGERPVTDTISRLFDAVLDTLRKIEKSHQRYNREGNLLGVDLLERLVQMYVGDLTFEEAYNRTKRVLNITVTTPDALGSPTLLNYLTARDVLIRSAAMASNTTSTNVERPAILLCKDESGNIVPWRRGGGGGEPLKSQRHNSSLRDNPRPLQRVAQLFNVNHFIVSQPRPYLAPYLRSLIPQKNSTKQQGILASFMNPITTITTPALKLASAEIHHRLAQLDVFGFLPPLPRRLLLDEEIPGAHIVLSPELTIGDLGKLLDSPSTREELAYWILKGERTVWPNVAALKVRCAIEVELDRAYQLVRMISAGSNTATGQFQLEEGADEEGAFSNVIRNSNGRVMPLTSLAGSSFKLE
jgi:TAG lipase / lysophosphatidylethanolamine acyltransferase